MFSKIKELSTWDEQALWDITPQTNLSCTVYGFHSANYSTLVKVLGEVVKTPGTVNHGYLKAKRTVNWFQTLPRIEKEISKWW